MTDRGTSYGDRNDWRHQAVCATVDSALWHPEPGHEQDSQKARALCHTCPVEGDCLNYALEEDIRYGIYGGMTDRQRRKQASDERHTP